MTENNGLTLSELETERLILRPIAKGDVSFLLTHFGHPDVNRWLVDNNPPKTEADAEEIVVFYTSGDDTRNRWIIEIKDEGRPIGTIGFHLWDRAHRRAEVGYDINSAWWRQGIGIEAVQGAVEFGMGPMQLHRIEAFVHIENTGSRKLLERLGFELEGIARQNFFHNGKFHDHWCFAKLADK